ncbi:RecX family transcriptional regulator [Paracrocinitomix mangrovi]|uniref:regulatory protein RecX n=1 Tax=Paracrocinitomix mangrovi TaxID=2862509 RepID=UPI001C8E8789|nr:regulatory protein RecX [Paracrocinitomix mangrovi]UKN03822.1 RecX family transcriptional regulator [Paracrocinitomix mangrovi]
MDRSPKYSLLEAKQKIEAFCAYQERCDYEVRQKLHSWFMHPEDVDVLISDLISNNFMNEERFAEAYASGKFRMKKWGKNKIKQQLKLKQISDYSINKGLNEIDDKEYLDTIEQLVSSKLKSVKGKTDWEKQMKVKQYLFGRGFEVELVERFLKE